MTRAGSSKPPPRRGAKPRPSGEAAGEAARGAHVKPTERTRHVIGNAAQRDAFGADTADAQGSEWPIESPRRAESKQND